MSQQDDFLTQPQAAPMWSLALRYGLLTGLALFALSMALELAGLVDPGARKGGGISYLVTFVVLFAGLYLAIKEYKKECGNTITYGTALKFAVLTSLVIALLGGILTLVQFTLISPDLTDQIRQLSIEDMEKRGATEEQRERGIKMMEIFITPAAMSVIAVLFQFFFAFLMALIAAALHQNAKNNTVV